MQNNAKQADFITSNVKSSLYHNTIEVRWSDCDANNHMRHTAYSDMAAHIRVVFFSQIGMTAQWYDENNIGPVLFKEETEYKREVNMSEQLTINVDSCEATGSTKSVQVVQSIYKSNGELAAVHRCVIAMMDRNVRKIIELPLQIKDLIRLSTKELVVP